MSSPGTMLRPPKTYYFNYFGGPWGVPGFGDMFSMTVSNSDFGKRSAAGDMTTFLSHVRAHVSESVSS